MAGHGPFQIHNREVSYTDNRESRFFVIRSFAWSAGPPVIAKTAFLKGMIPAIREQKADRGILSAMDTDVYPTYITEKAKRLHERPVNKFEKRVDS